MVFTAAKTMLDALILFAICELMALTFALVGGAVIDTFYEAMVSSGLMNIPGGWGDFTTLDYLIGLYYVSCICVCLYGVLILFLTIYHKYIVEEDEEEDTAVYTGGNYE